MSEPSTSTTDPITWRPNASDWWRAYRRAPAFWIAAIVLGYIAVQGLSDIVSGQPLIGLILLAIGPIPFALLMGYRNRQFARAATYDIVLTPGEAGLRVDAGTVHITHEWPRLAARENAAGVAVLTEGSGPVLQIPWRAFAGRGEAAAFVQLVRLKGDVSPPSGDIRAR